MDPSSLSLIPPLLVLAFAFFAQSIIPALILGIIVAGSIATHSLSIASVHLIIQRLQEQLLDIDTLHMFGFLLIIGIIVTLINHLGGTFTLTQLVTRKAKSTRTVEYISLLLSTTLSLDDYLSSLTVGHVIQPLTKIYHISRERLAYLIHSMAGPLVIITPISSFMAYITTQLDQTGITKTPVSSSKIYIEPFFAYLNIIPFTFYSLLTLLSVWYVVQTRINFNHPRPSFLDELSLLNHAPQAVSQKQSILNLFLPLMLLIFCTIIGILYQGQSTLFGGPHSLIESFQYAQTSRILFYAALCTLCISFCYGMIRYPTSFSLPSTQSIVTHGIRLMLPALIMVILASTFGLLLRKDLMTGHYLAHFVLYNVPTPIIPALIFITSLSIALTTGSSWATIAVMFPIVLPLLLSLAQLEQATALSPDALPLLFPALGAILSGAIAGDHISPLSETTLMSANSAGCSPLQHASTQFPYTIPPIIGSIIAFLAVGYLATSRYNSAIIIILPLILGFASCLLLFTVLSRYYNRMR
ncbi:MAG: Na+/H+ antiporter NhaC family protein [Candidatus Babeliales bacterium]